jgi:hypothetical protein
MTAYNTPRLYIAVCDWATSRGMPTGPSFGGIWEGVTEDWIVKVNGTRRELDGIPAFGAFLEHRHLLAFAFVCPGGGDLIGPDEQELITHFEALIPVRAVA